MVNMNPDGTAVVDGVKLSAEQVAAIKTAKPAETTPPGWYIVNASDAQKNRRADFPLIYRAQFISSTLAGVAFDAHGYASVNGSPQRDKWSLYPDCALIYLS